MVRPFKLFQKLRNFIAVPNAQRERCHHKRLGISLFLRITQTALQQAVHRPFEGSARAPSFLLDECGNVVVDGESGSHIMMLGWKAS